MQKGLTLEGKILKIVNKNLSLMLNKNNKINHHIKIKIHKFIILKFQIDNDILISYMNLFIIDQCQNYPDLTNFTLKLIDTGF